MTPGDLAAQLERIPAALVKLKLVELPTHLPRQAHKLFSCCSLGWCLERSDPSWLNDDPTDAEGGMSKMCRCPCDLCDQGIHCGKIQCSEH